jgi:signal transduction histidine kinase
VRLFAKYFLCATLVISIALLVSGYLLITLSHESALARETERALNQFQFDKFAIQANLIANPDVRDERLLSNLSGAAAVYFDDKSIPRDIPDDSHVYWFEDSNIIVCGRITQGDVTLYLLVTTDINAVVEQRERMTQSFAMVYFVTLLISMVVIMTLSAFITLPVKRMSKVAAGIARGRYNERLSISGGDEIGELSKSFNLMADSVEEKINELSENARQKEEFVANFAHELKTPLTSVIGYADMIYQKNLPPEQVKDAAWYILSEGLRLEALSLKLMDLIVLNKQDFVLEGLDAEELFSNIAGSLKPVFEERKVTLRLKILPARVMVEYDLFKTLLLNLIDNAMKAGCRSIHIAGKPDGNRYSVCVSDNGRGIPKSELKHITEAFYMVDKSRARKQHGAGLGLTLAARIAEIHGSSLDFMSEEGVGTVVKFDLACERGVDDE